MYAYFLHRLCRVLKSHYVLYDIRSMSAYRTVFNLFIRLYCK